MPVCLFVCSFCLQPMATFGAGKSSRRSDIAATCTRRSLNHFCFLLVEQVRCRSAPVVGSGLSVFFFWPHGFVSYRTDVIFVFHSFVCARQEGDSRTHLCCCCCCFVPYVDLGSWKYYVVFPNPWYFVFCILRICFGAVLTPFFLHHDAMFL